MYQEGKMTKLAKINKPAALSSIAYDALRESILSFHLKQNIVYNEKAVAQELGLSRTPVREALLKLASQGLVTFLPRKGFIVSAYTLEDVEEIFELREMIETSVAKKISANVSDDALKTLKANIATQHKAAAKKDRHSFMLSDREFHFFFFKLSKNKRLVEITDNFQDLCHLMGANALKNEENYERTIVEHEGIVDALESHDALKTEKAVSRHLAMVKKIVKITLEI